MLTNLFFSREGFSGFKTIFGNGFEVGGFATIPVSEIFSIQPEITFLYSEIMGLLLEQNGSGATIESRKTATGFQPPILAKLTLPVGSGKIGLLLGPQFSFGVGNINVKNTFSIPNYDVQTYKAENSYEDDETERFIFSGVVGVDYSLPLGPEALLFDARLTYDFTNLSSASGTELKRLQIKPSIGYGFSL